MVGRGWVSVLVVAASWTVAAAAADAPAPASASGALAGVRVTQLVAIITAIGALGTAAFGLVDATKAFQGGLSNVGLRGLLTVVGRFAVALESALGTAENGEPEWRNVVRAHWINGRPRDEQKAIVKSLIRLGLGPHTAHTIAKAGRVSPDGLAAVASKLEEGAPLTPVDLNLLGRLDASIEAQLDAAYDRADQCYRNVARACAGLFAIGLALLAAPAVGETDWRTAFVVGLLAVPLAPIAKDLASSLQAAAAALRAAK